MNIHLNLNNLNKCEIQNAIVPLVNKLLKSKKINIQLPKIDWGAWQATAQSARSRALQRTAKAIIIESTLLQTRAKR